MTSLSLDYKMVDGFSLVRLRAAHIVLLYEPTPIASAPVDFHWEGKSRAAPHKKSVRGVGIFRGAAH